MTMPNDVNKFIFEGQDEEAIPNAGSDSEGVSCQQTSRGSAQEKDEGKWETSDNLTPTQEDSNWQILWTNSKIILDARSTYY